MKRHVALALTFGLVGMSASAANAATADSQDSAQTAAEPVAADPAHATSVAVATDAAQSAALAPAQEQAARDTEVAFTPYLWVAGTKGSIGIPRNSGEVNVDKSFADILGSLKFAFMGALDVRHKNFVVLGDVIYLSVGAKAESIRDPAFFTGHVDAKTFVGSLAGGYRVIDKGPMFVDVFAGARVISLDAKLELEGPLATRHAHASASTVAPLVGARLRAPIGRTWALGLYGDAGGLVKGSDVKWQLMANIQHDFSKHWGMMAGYRYMSINHDNERFDFDINLSGPLVGATYTF